ncbi:hypothetical protein CLMAG_27320 [Clostridium magnum DSM 2767]|uniref:Uncharacterized protein n=1 Tax=Clostridium magnum DSM 2767 TaxID=1121326 RepID=A0A161X0G8_9CLOT|nr:hypothetical protein CLMAG_27320 [Clostridium magnum DSM 2767]SHJ16232.1 hypothetical protein SAMN02745944_05458 [Clostridium magnum DSM 2767]
MAGHIIFVVKTVPMNLKETRSTIKMAIKKIIENLNYIKISIGLKIQ